MVIRINNMLDRELFCEEVISSLPVSVQKKLDEKLVTLCDAYGKYFESSYGGAEIYIITDSDEEGADIQRRVLEFYNIDPDSDVPEYSECINEGEEDIYSEILWLLVNGEKPILIFIHK